MFHLCWHCTAETASLDWHNMSNALEWVPFDELFYCLRGSFTPSMHTLFSNPFCHGHCCTHYPMTCLAREQCQLNAIFLSDEGICVALIVVHYGCTWASRLLLVVNVCPAIIKEYCTVSTPLSMMLHAGPPTGYKFPLVWHHSHEKTKPHCVLWYLTMFPVGLPSLNWFYGYVTCLQCPLMVV